MVEDRYRRPTLEDCEEAVDFLEDLDNYMKKSKPRKVRRNLVDRSPLSENERKILERLSRLRDQQEKSRK